MVRRFLLVEAVEQVGLRSRLEVEAVVVGDHRRMALVAVEEVNHLMMGEVEWVLRLRVEGVVVLEQRFLSRVVEVGRGLVMVVEERESLNLCLEVAVELDLWMAEVVVRRVVFVQ